MKKELKYSILRSIFGALYSIIVVFLLLAFVNMSLSVLAWGGLSRLIIAITAFIAVSSVYVSYKIEKGKDIKGHLADFIKRNDRKGSKFQ